MSVVLSRKKKALFSFLIICVALVAINFLAKALERRQQGNSQIARAIEHPYWRREDKAKLPITLIKNYDDGWVKINSLGYAGEEFSAIKPVEKFRIACIGDSCTFGTFGTANSYPTKLGKLLNQDSATKHYEVINAGIEGATSAWALERMRDVMQYQPDLIVVYIGWNDLYSKSPRADFRQSSMSDRIETLLMRVAMFRTIRRWIFVDAKKATMQRERTADEQRFLNYQPQLYEDNLREMVTLAAAEQKKLVLLTLPSVVSEKISDEGLKLVHLPFFTNSVGDFLTLIGTYNRTVKKIAGEKKLPLIDMAAYFDSLPNKESYFIDSVHMTKKGSRLLAEQLVLQLRGQNLLDNK